MEIRELNLQEMEGIYASRMAEDFPPNELRPFCSIRQLTQAGLYYSFGCYENGLAGYAAFAVAKEKDALLLDYYAVDAARRGQGIGTRFLPRLREAVKPLGAAYVLIEAESLESAQAPAQTEERARRIRFYEGCGCRRTQVYSWLFGVEYQILVLPLDGRVPEDAQVEAALGKVYQTIVPPLVGPGAFAEVCRTFRR